ncbi:hypothetical protein THRCLA_05172 [Thraustotheca clavata]|uniref:Centrosomal protein of 162 kDa n=1 Tax=Thraustotheca clavata TaxID=74557 RepID=A0A1V9ZWR9_9STRA|nr:hypothetical protein THRCLA_05172 [Thraustotheca clavata]
MNVLAQSNENEKKSRKRKQKKAKVISQPRKLSLEERVADILKRHGSAQVEEEVVAAPVEGTPMAETQTALSPVIETAIEPTAATENVSDESSDSLGMESADFEVGGYGKKLKAVDVKKEISEKEQNYDDEQSEARSSFDAPFVLHAVPQVHTTEKQPDRYDVHENTTEEPKEEFESTFAKMKELFTLETVPAADTAPVDNESNGYGDDTFDNIEANEDVLAKESADDVMHMYEADEFEESTDIAIISPPPPPPPLEFDPPSPGPPPPPDNIPEQPEPLNLDHPLEEPSSITPLYTFSEEPPTFQYDLRAKVVETIIPPPELTTTIECDEIYSRQNTEIKVDIVTTMPNPVQTRSFLSDQVVQQPSNIDQRVREQTPSTEQHIVLQNQVVNPEVAIITRSILDQIPPTERFKQLQEQLSKSQLELTARSNEAFERDKIMIRAFSNKENEMKLQLQAAEREILALQHQVEALSTDKDVHTLSDARLLGKYVHSQSSNGVTMTNNAYETMRKEMETQEGLIKGYQIENERLMQQLKDVRRDLEYDVHLNNQELQATIKELRQQLQHQQKPARHLEVQLQADARIRSLEEELYLLRENHKNVERELKYELDTVKQAKKELECRIAGVQMDKLAQENEAYNKLQADYNALKNDCDAKVAQVQSKLDWYIQNQRYIDEQDELLRYQRETIDDLKQQLAVKTNAKSKGRAPSDIKRIQALEAQLAEMEKAMRKRHPDSLVNLILASKPAHEDQLNDLRNHYEQELEALQKQLSDAEHTHELKMTAFRQQHERIVQQLEQQSKPKENTDITRLRTFYQKKIKELERKLEHKGNKPENETQIYQGDLSSKAAIERLEKECVGLKTELANVHQQLQLSEEARQHLVQTLASTISKPDEPPKHELQPPNDGLLDKIQFHQQEYDDLKSKHVVEMQQTKDLLHEEILRLTTKLTDAHYETQRVMEVAARVPHLEETISDLTRQLQIPNTPSMLQYHTLEMQINALMQKYTVREAELEALLQQATTCNQLEKATLQHQYESKLALKNAEILDEMLTELEALRQ